MVSVSESAKEITGISCIQRMTAPAEAGMVDGTGGVKSASNASITLSGAVHSS